MTASSGFLTALVILATIVATVSPVVLLVLWVRDWRRGRLW